jgi:hypothetical protein
MARDPLKARAVKARSPLDTNQMNGRVLNAPRMMQMGGASALNVAGGPHKNRLTIRKPGGSA